MPPRTPPAEHAIEAQCALRTFRRACVPLWAAAVASGDWSLMADAHALSGTLRVAQMQLRRIAGRADSIACPDGIRGANHGRAA